MPNRTDSKTFRRFHRSQTAEGYGRQLSVGLTLGPLSVFLPEMPCWKTGSRLTSASLFPTGAFPWDAEEPICKPKIYVSAYPAY